MKILSWLMLLGMIAAYSAFAETTTSELMGVMGDSISAGTFANHSAVADPSNPGTVSYDSSTTPRFSGKTVHFPSYSTLPFLGNWENENTYSWASGQDVTSHFVLLQNWLAQFSIPLTVLNVAVPGSVATDLVAQANQLAQAMASGQYSALEYVTVMIGANDACTDVADADMQTALEQTFAILAGIQQASPIHVLVSSVPKIPDLGRTEITNTETVGGLACGQLRDRMLKECPLTVWTTQDEYNQNLAAVDAKNLVLQNVVAEMPTKAPNLQVVYSSSFYDATILPEYLARDCFHPDQEGHNTISQRLWADQPWFK